MTDGNRSDGQPEGWSEILIDVLSGICWFLAALIISRHNGMLPSFRPVTRVLSSSWLVDIWFEGTLLEMLFLDLLTSMASATILNLGLSSTLALASTWLCTTLILSSQRFCTIWMSSWTCWRLSIGMSTSKWCDQLWLPDRHWLKWQWAVTKALMPGLLVHASSHSTSLSTNCCNIMSRRVWALTAVVGWYNLSGLRQLAITIALLPEDLSTCDLVRIQPKWVASSREGCVP